MRKRYNLSILMMIVVLVLAACTLPFVGTEEKTVYVGSYTVECEGEGSQMCLLVKENPTDKYTFFYDQIEGFDYEEGYDYVLTVKEEPVDNPPAGGSSIKWVLVEVVSKTQAPQARSAAGFEGIPWRLIAYRSEQGEIVNVLPGSEITAGYLAGQVTGYAGCNNYFGSYQVEGDQLRFSEIGSTEMLCSEPEGVMQRERDYLGALELAESYQITDDQFFITDAAGETILLYARSKPVQLTGTDWRLDFYNGGEGSFVSVLAGTEISILFSEDGELIGSAGCNRYSATYETDGKSVEIGTAVTTRMYCEDPEGIMEQESAYLMALASAVTYQIQDNALTMEDVDGVRVLSFTALVEDVEVDFSPTEEVSELVGPLWKWLAFVEPNDDQLFVDDPNKYSIEFLPDGQVSVQADCNRVGGTYQEDGDRVLIELGASTLAACPPGSLADGFLRLLEDAVMYSIERQYMYLDTANQTGRLAFTSVDEVIVPPTAEAAVTETPAPTDAPAPAQTPTPTYTPIPTPTQLPNIVFEDDFSSDTGWMLYKADTHGFTLKEGAYNINVKTPNGFIWSVRSLSLADLALETDAHRVEGTEAGYYGIVCRYQSGINYYALVVSESGSYGIVKMEHGLLEFLAEGTDEEGIIHHGDRVNRVRGDCVGDTLTLYVNGEKLLEVQDGTFKDGNVGLIALTFKEKLLKVMFDYFAVYEK